MSNLLSDMLAAKKKSLRAGNRDAAIAFNRAIAAYDRDDADSVSFWVKHAAMCIPGMFVKAITMLPVDKDAMAAYKREMNRENLSKTAA
jgi:hypothetical protein